jgi:hypothetical protein
MLFFSYSITPVYGLPFLHHSMMQASFGILFYSVSMTACDIARTFSGETLGRRAS